MQQYYDNNDLDSIEELNYISTIEEDAIIDTHIEKLREWGYGSIKHPHDLQQLFWEFSRRGVLLDKLFRVAVVECIDEESLYTKFLGMAKHYNRWANKQNGVAIGQQDITKELAKKDSLIEKYHRKFQESQERVSQLNNEIASLKRDLKPKSEGAQIVALRKELKKMYNIELQEMRHKEKPNKMVGKAMMKELRHPESRIFKSFDFTREEDVRDYIEWFKLSRRKIIAPIQRAVLEQHGPDKLETFMSLVNEYNSEWEASHQKENDQEDESPESPDYNN